MRNLIFTIVGSSNAVGLQNVFPKHPIFTNNNVKLINRSRRGMNAKGKKSKRSFLKYNFVNKPNQFYVLFLGPNGFRHRHLNPFLSTYLKNINTVTQTVVARKLVVILPMPRGHFHLHAEQMKAVKEFGLKLIALGIHVINPYLHLPRRLRHAHSLFGKKDLKRKKYVHYSHKVRGKVYHLLGDKLREIVLNHRKPDSITTPTQNLAITSAF